MTAQNSNGIFLCMTQKYDSPERISAFLAASCSFLAISAASLASLASFSAAILAASLSIRSCFWASRVDCLSLILFSRSVTNESSSSRFFHPGFERCLPWPTDDDGHHDRPLVTNGQWSALVHLFLHGPLLWAMMRIIIMIYRDRNNFETWLEVIIAHSLQIGQITLKALLYEIVIHFYEISILKS